MSESLISRTEHPAPYNDNDNDQVKLQVQVKVQVCLNQPRQLPRPPHLQQLNYWQLNI